MARIRTIKPEFFRHEGLQDLAAEHGAEVMLVFAGLWGQCDKNGRFEWKPRTLKLDILPFLDFDMGKTLELLWEAGFLRKYVSDGREYGEIDSFEKHQRISGKEAQENGKHPAPTEYLPISDGYTPRSTGESREKQPESQEGKGKGKGKEGKGKEIDVAQSARREQVAAVFDFWKRTMGHERSVLDPKRSKLIDTRLKEGYPAETLCEAIAGCAQSPWHMGENDRGQRYDGLDLILRDAGHIDKFVATNREPPKPKGKQAMVEANNRAAADEFLRGSGEPYGDPGGHMIDGEVSHG